METKNRFVALTLAVFFLISFILAIFWPGSVGVLLLTLAVLGILAVSFFYPRAAFIALIIIRTAADFLTNQEIFHLGALSVNFTSLVGVIVLVFAVTVFIKEKGWRQVLPLVPNWLVFLGLAFVLIFFSISPFASLVEFLRWSSFFALFILGFFLFRGSRPLTTLIRVLIFSSLIPTLAALWQALNGQGVFDGERLRVNGTFVHPNMLAFYLVFVATLSLFIFLTLKKQAVEKYVYLVLAFPLLAALILTYTRGAWLCLFFILFWIGLKRFRLFLTTALLLLAMFYVVAPPFQERLNSLASFSASDSTVWRLDLWRDALSYTPGHLAVGYGPGTAPLVIGQYRSYVLGSSEPHNDYIKLLLEVGIFGLVAYVWLAIGLLRRLYQGYRQEKFSRRRLLFLFMLIFSASLFLFSAGDNILKDSSLQWSFWALNGALLYAGLQAKCAKADMVV
jgi:O-antigen ligase